MDRSPGRSILRRRVAAALGIVVVASAAVAGGLLVSVRGEASAPGYGPVPLPEAEVLRSPKPTVSGDGGVVRPRFPEVEWRDSVALGEPTAGSLVRGVKLPREGRDFITWDPIERTSPSRGWRRYGTDRLVRTILRVLADHRRAHPRAQRLVIGDLSRPRGGDFGPQFGSIGHASHQNGLDADIYFPRRDRAPRPPRAIDQVDLGLSQDLVDRFVAAGAEKVFVGPNTGLTGPPDVVQAIPYHDNHLHVRLTPGA